MNFIGNKEELHQEWKKSVILLMYRMGDKSDFNGQSFRLMSLCGWDLGNVYCHSVELILSCHFLYTHRNKD